MLMKLDGSFFNPGHWPLGGRIVRGLSMGIALLCFCLGPGAAASQAPEPRPNIILILSDDVGAETIGVYGGESFQTPKLDQLARDGIRFDYGHAQPLCTPSRVKIMTGQYNFRNYRHFAYLDPSERTFAHLLKQAGYSTYLVGKWQMNTNPYEDVTGATPEDAGFDDYLAWHMSTEPKGSRYWGPLLNHDGTETQHPDSMYGPDMLHERVLATIEAQRDGPFFIYYSMVLAHDPWVTTPDMRDESASDQEKFAAMMAYMDKLVGNVRSKVEEAGIGERTVIFFVGDNGTGRDIVSRQHGNDVRGAKGKTIDAGSRVPFIAWGPGVIDAGRVSGSLVNFNDIFPTLAALAGVDLPGDYPGDGMNLVPLMSAGVELPRENIFIHYEPFWPTAKPARYAFDRRWKLYEGGGFYDMRTDPLEQRALDPDGLDTEAAVAYRALSDRIDNMPGALSSTRRWIPRQFYYLAGTALAALIAIAWLSWRLIRMLRGKQMPVGRHKG